MEKLEKIRQVSNSLADSIYNTENWHSEDRGRKTEDRVCVGANGERGRRKRHPYQSSPLSPL
jgi:hypothetical protein